MISRDFFVFYSRAVYGNSSKHVRSNCTYLKEEKRVPVKLGVVAPLDPARHLLKKGVHVISECDKTQTNNPNFSTHLYIFGLVIVVFYDEHST
jgi:hypothetical protein